MASTPAAPAFGATVTLTASLTAASGQPMPTGTVAFTDGAVGLGVAPVGADGRASVGVSTLSAGTHSIVAIYSGDTVYQPATAAAVSISVGKAATTLALTSSAAQPGQPVILQAAVTVAGGGAAGGTVTMTNGTTPICASVSLQNGIAACTTLPLLAGAYTINASYSGDANTAASTASLPLTVGKAAAGITTVFTPAAPVSGAAVTLTASLTAASGQPMPTGTVTFSDGPVPIGTAAVGADGRASVVPNALGAGTHSIGAFYSGDSIYQSATAAAVTIVVGKAATTLALTPGAAQAGQPVTLTATLTVAGGGTSSGTVTMSNGATSICTGVALQSGIATSCTTQPLTAGVYTIGASYSGDGNTAASTATLSLTVGKAAAGITAASTPSATVFGATVTITASLVAASGQPMPTGTVAFTDGAASLGTPPVGADGHASLGVSTLVVGTHSIVAVYSGDAVYQPATAAAVSIVVGKAATTLALTSNAAQPGQPLTLKATVAVAGGGAAAGTVSMSNGTNPICTGVAVQNGIATCTTQPLQSGVYTINATYSGDGNTAASTATLAVNVIQGAPGIATASVPAAPVYGAAVTITASLTGASGQPIPTGTVAFSDGPASLGTAPVGSDGRASVVAGALSVGTHSIVAAYSGDVVYQGATAAAMNLVVAKAATSVALTASAPQVGQPVTLRAAVTVVSPGNATPGGTVDFSSGGVAIAGCTGIAVQNGSAACSASFSQVGGLTIGASYSGDANTAPSTATLALTVAKAVPGFYTATTQSAPPYGATVTVNALLLGATGLATPGGTVAFADGATALSTVAVGSDGHASLTLSTLGVGSHGIAAVYSGDANYQTATAPVLAIVVSKAATSVALAASPAQINQPVNLKAAVTVVSPGSAPLGGTLDFSNGGNAIAGCTGMILQNGTAACSTSFSQLGSSTIGATYNGDANTAPGTATIQVTVGKASAGIYTAFTPAAPVYGATVSINALLLGATGLATPTGAILFSDGGSPLGSAPVGTDGRASLVLPSAALAPLSAGSHSVVAAYSGDANYGSSTADPLSLTVAKASTSTQLTAGAGGVLTATVTVLPPGAGTPTGSVQFFQGTSLMGTSGIASQGTGFVATLAATAQSGSVSAVYQGDSNFSGSTSAAVTLAGRVQVSISSDHNPSAAGQAVTFTVRVSASSGIGTPSGSVQLSADGTAVGTASLSGGQATVMATLAVGTHAIAASYSGDSVYAAGTASMQQVVNQAAIGLTLTSSAGATVYGQPVTLTAQLGSPTLAGTVQFLDGATALGSAQASSGVATFTALNLSVGVHPIQATWAGDANSAAATSAVLPETVTQAQTSTTLTASGSTLTASVTVTAPGTGLPTGSVKFVDSTTNVPLASVTLAGATASTPMPSTISATQDSIVAVYSGDANFQASTSSPLARLTVVNAASYALASFAPDEIGTLFGANLATATTSASGPPTTPLGGTTVTITDSVGAPHAAALLFVSPGQVSFLMPSDAATGPATVVVTNANQVATSAAILVSRVAPGLFTLDSTGQGLAAAQTVLVHADLTQDAPQDVAVYDPAKKLWVASPIYLGGPGDVVYLLLYGTGIRHYSALPTCTIGGFAATVAFAGAQGSFAGLDQVNVVLPQGLRGMRSQQVILLVDGTTSNPVTLAFQ